MTHTCQEILGHRASCSSFIINKHIHPFGTGNPNYQFYSLHWRHNDHDGVWNHQPHGCLLNRLFRRRLKKASKLRVTGLCVGNSPEPVNSPHKGPVTRKMFPFDDVIMLNSVIQLPLPILRTISHNYQFNSSAEGSLSNIYLKQHTVHPILRKWMPSNFVQYDTIYNG